ncbi:hypothetical protein AB0F72_21565 [Actinoplanes sp. NPDC023936]|uniref:hypothetical protein n=1 Tax=Actinoplanes sp. NPDC023936 TaxID=3154910 RepID=UPI0033FC9981
MSMYANEADGDLHIGAQIGVLHGNATIYHTAPAAGPSERLQVAVNYLRGGSPREAERRISALVFEDRLSSAEVAYHWVLSVLSGRSLTSLSGNEMHQLEQAFAMSERHPSGRWWRCVETIRMLVNALLVVGPDGQPAAPALGRALQAYATLPDDDRQEIERHLTLTLSGVAQDHIEDLNADHVRRARMSGDRAVRVPKFFEPDPAEPIAKIACPAPAESTWLPLAGGGALLLVGAVTLVQAAGTRSVVAAVTVFVLLVAGGYAVVRHGLDRAFLRSRLAAKEDEFQTGRRPAYTGPGGGSLSAGFADAISAIVDTAFTAQQPREHQMRDAFWRDTTGLRTALQGDLIDLYGVRGIRPEAIRWLAAHHAEGIAGRWRDGSLDDFRRQYRPAAMSPAFLGGLAALAGAGLIVLLSATAMTACALVVAAPLLWFGARLAHRGGLALYGERRRIALDAAEFQERYQAECLAYDRWVAWLADRPTDVEMGNWLALDLAHWKRGVMADYRLSNRDLLTHLTLTEAAPRSRRARDVGGPFRHSAYTVLLFLLTEGGVRQVQTRLDFMTGAFSGERRTTFRYDAIGSVRVTEVGLRVDDQKLVSRQAFQLSLNNGERIRVLLDDFADEPIDDYRESADHLARLASDAAGVTSATHILEAVAAEGREWIALERQRLHRRLPRQQPPMPSPVTYSQLPYSG